MIRSMTGYGRATKIAAGYTITIELRSVNHRYFDCTVRAPRVFVYMEEPVKARLQKAVARGKVDVFVTLEAGEDSGLKVELNLAAADSYVAALKELKERYSLDGKIELMSLARFPEVFTVEKAEADEDELLAAVLSTLDEALEGYIEMSAREGENLAADILARAAGILEAVDRIEARSEAAVADYREKLLARMKDLLASVTIDESRILTEAAIYADKTAITEEAVRLRSHVAQLRELFAAGGQVGRKLDFLIQEFNREANTIGSKGNDVELAREVVDLKAEIEKIREQVQNIE